MVTECNLELVTHFLISLFPYGIIEEFSVYFRMGGGLRLVFSGYIDFVFHFALRL